MQDVIENLMALGPLPSSVGADIQLLEKMQNLLSEIKTPISDDEAHVLITLFGPDDCFGLAWTLIHAIETAPSWPIRDLLGASENEWVALLKSRARIE